MEHTLLDIGVLVGAHGIRGALRVKVFSPDAHVFAHLRQVVMRLPGGEVRVARLRGTQKGTKGLALLSLEGVEDRQAAEALVGAVLSIAREDLPPLEPDEFYLADAVGLLATSPSGEPLGRVVAVGDNGAQPLLFLEDADVEYHVPAVPPFVQAFDGVHLVLALPDGLREAVAEPRRPKP